MKQYLFIALSFAVLTISCGQKHEIVEGDMYYQVIDLLNFFDAPDSVLQKIEDSFSSINPDTLSEKDKKELGILLHAFENQLLRSPYIRVHPDTGKEFMLFMGREAYEQFEIISYNKLVLEEKKIRVNAEVEDVSFKNVKAYKVTGFLNVTKVDGKPMRRK